MSDEVFVFLSICIPLAILMAGWVAIAKVFADILKSAITINHVRKRNDVFYNDDKFYSDFNEDHEIVDVVAGDWVYPSINCSHKEFKKALRLFQSIGLMHH